MQQPKTPLVPPVQSVIACIRSLQSHRHVRNKSQLCAIEGIRQFIRAHDAGFQFNAIIHSPVLLQSILAQKLVRKLGAAGVARHAVSPELFRSFSTTERASGIAAIVRQCWTPLAKASPCRGLGWLVVEQIRSPGNLGTILRTAEAVGMSGVIFVGDACDPYDPRVIRASMGGIFHLPLVRTTPRELGYWLAANQIDVVGLSPMAEKCWTDLSPGRMYALVLGEEREGLSPSLRRLCDLHVRLPMTGRADSLNVAVAAGVMMYELVRNSGNSRIF